jgi:hypothetical protein
MIRFKKILKKFIKLLTCKIASVRFETGDVPDVNVDNKNPLTPYEQSYSPFYVKQNNIHKSN